MKHRYLSLVLLPLMLTLSCQRPTEPGHRLLADAFENSGADAKPWVYWYWMNGNVTREGITADIEAMNRVGIGGAFLMCIGGPWDRPGLEKAYDPLTPEWWDLVDHAFAEAERCGMKLGMSACDGWATAGGPFVDPEHAMKKVVWSISRLQGPTDAFTPPHPPLHAGTYQNSGHELTGERRFYRDIACFAFPAREGIDQTMADYDFEVQTSIPDIRAEKLFDGDLRETTVNTNQNGYIQVTFSQPFTCRSVRMFVQADRWFPYPYYPASMDLLTSEDGTDFRLHHRFTPDQHGWQDDGTPVTFRIPEVTARFFRFIFDTDTLIPISMRFVGAERKYLSLTEIELSSFPWIDRFEAKGAYRYRVSPPTPGELQSQYSIALDEMVDVTGYLDSAGMLNWQAPAGEWNILRMGNTLTNNENETGGGGIGLESDKLSKEATRIVFDGWLGEAIRRIGRQRADSVLALMHVDSWEAATQNWTDRFPEWFRQKRGYDMVPFLPALAGIPVESHLASESFLHDFRTTLIELLNENFYGELSRLARENGSAFSAEATAPVMVSDGMLHHKYVDRPMGEFWRDDPAPMDKPEDILEAVSGGHLYNRPIVQAEAFTDVDSKWYEHPFLLKKQGDFNFCRGINLFFLHVYVQQPFVDKKPGFTLGQTGMHFTRGQTWWEQSEAWIEYLTRCQSVLQQGHQVAQILAFTGMEIPRRALLPEQLYSDVPDGYRYLSINPDALLNEVRILDGAMSLPNGARHKVLMLPPEPFHGNGLYTPAVMKKIQRLVKGGVIVLGPRPKGAAGLDDRDKADKQVKAIADRLWGPEQAGAASVNRYGKGMVYCGFSLEDVLKRENLIPDLLFPSADSMDYIHKVAGSSHLWFVSNQRDIGRQVSGSFPITGRVPEIWDPVTTKKFRADYREIEGRTEIQLDFAPHGSVFVVFPESPDPALETRQELETQQSIPLQGNWRITFEENRGLEKDFTIETDQLVSLTTHADPNVKHFSGTAAYHLSFDLHSESGDSLHRFLLDLGRVADMARVIVNDRDMGLLWAPPFITDVTDALMSGENRLRIEVTNTWNNRIVFDMSLPKEERVSYFPHYDQFPGAGDQNGFLIRSVDYNLRETGLIGPCRIDVKK